MADVDIDNKRTEWRIIKENKANALKTKTVSDSPSTVMLSSVTDSTNDSMNPVDSFIHAFDDIDLNKLKDPKLLDVLREQTEKMYSLINQIQAKRQRQQTESTNNLTPKPTIQAERQGPPNKKTTIDVSEDLISQLDKDIEMRKRTQHMTTTKTYTTELILERTVELTIDETMVKEALKKDPYIQRILKLNNMKKKEYYS
ncbi:hypothetical protein O0L34_g15900 [Tuta absoluta]|nr:hypothetical protein O0L34_g10518 [Tuta absoluta]KAJ2942351.1 hypothetical protein O0L34_g15900 [Tuta absoluta]